MRIEVKSTNYAIDFRGRGSFWKMIKRWHRGWGTFSWNDVIKIIVLPLFYLKLYSVELGDFVKIVVKNDNNMDNMGDNGVIEIIDDWITNPLANEDSTIWAS